MDFDKYITNEPNTREEVVEWRNSIHLGDCLEIMKGIPDKGIDLICADLPYGTTQCSWDSIIPLRELWNEYKRIIKPNGNIVLFSDEPFTSALIMSNIDWFRQRITWNKMVAGNHLNSKKMLLKITEDICLFTPLKLGNQTYNPQLTTKLMKHRRGDRKRENRKSFNGGYVGKHNGQVSDNYNEEVSYPNNLWNVNSKQGECNALNRLHPTQKPIELLTGLILTYSNEDDIVLDNTMGSGSTCIACKQNDRIYIGIEKEEKYFRIAERRLDETLL